MRFFRFTKSKVKKINDIIRSNCENIKSYKGKTSMKELNVRYKVWADHLKYGKYEWSLLNIKITPCSRLISCVLSFWCDKKKVIYPR